MPEFDKYAPFVWWAYGLAAVILGGLLVLSIVRHANARKRLEDAEREDPS
jgi:heme exporter protein CcmD